MKRRFVPALSLLSSLIAAADAEEAVAPSGPALTGTVCVLSEYLFRGLAQTSQGPALQAGIEYGSVDSGYVGGWGSDVSVFSDLSAPGFEVCNSLEIDVYAGWRILRSEQWKFDADLYTYYYPGDYYRGLTRPNTTEVYAGISYAIALLKYSHALTNAFGFADAKNSDYLDLSANWKVTPWWRLNGHVDHQRIDGIAAAGYTDWKLGVTKNFGNGIAVAHGYYDTNTDEVVYSNSSSQFLGRSTGVFNVSKSF